jgi:hypothetical protein
LKLSKAEIMRTTIVFLLVICLASCGTKEISTGLKNTKWKLAGIVTAQGEYFKRAGAKALWEMLYTCF